MSFPKSATIFASIIIAVAATTTGAYAETNLEKYVFQKDVWWSKSVPTNDMECRNVIQGYSGRNMIILQNFTKQSSTAYLASTPNMDKRLLDPSLDKKIPLTVVSNTQEGDSFALKSHQNDESPVSAATEIFKFNTGNKTLSRIDFLCDPKFTQGCELERLSMENQKKKGMFEEMKYCRM